MARTFSGKVWEFGDGLNTDAMYPGFAMKMDPAGSRQTHVLRGPAGLDR